MGLPVCLPRRRGPQKRLLKKAAAPVRANDCLCELTLNEEERN